jgi:SAM-dependent methyltransferase
MTIDFSAVKAKQQVAWSTAYNDIGVRLGLISERLCELVDVHAGEKVLDVACGNGNTALAAARRFANVTGIDYADPLLDHARARAEVEGLDIDFRHGDAEALAFHNSSFDVVLSTIGVMFAPDQETAAAELLRVTRPGGRIGLANWSVDGAIAELFATIAKHVSPPPGLRPPTRWGDEHALRELFKGALGVDIRPQTFHMHAPSEAAWVDWFHRDYGPVTKAFDAVGASGEAALRNDLLDLVKRYNVSETESLKLRLDYLEVVIRR